MSRRYYDRQAYTNANSSYREILKNRNTSAPFQFVTPRFFYLSSDHISNLSTKVHIWKYGDRYYKLAQKHYDDPKLWWIIAYFNEKPTEGHVKLGDKLYIPFPIDLVLTYMGL